MVVEHGVSNLLILAHNSSHFLAVKYVGIDHYIDLTFWRDNVVDYLLSINVVKKVFLRDSYQSRVVYVPKVVSILFISWLLGKIC